MLPHGGRAGLIFGPEASGLDNDDVVRADCLVTADLNPDYPSLNLAQAVLLMAWEWRMAAHAGKAAGTDADPLPEPATVLSVTASMNVWNGTGRGRLLHLA